MSFVAVYHVLDLSCSAVAFVVVAAAAVSGPDPTVEEPIVGSLHGRIQPFVAERRRLGE